MGQLTLLGQERENIRLRPYQEDFTQAIFASWAKGNRRVLGQLPTGAGKTVIFSHLCRTFLERGEGVLVVAHRLELILQAKEKLEAISGLPCGVIKAGFPVELNYDVQVASIQSLVRRKRYPEAGLVIIDEAHHSCAKSYTTVLEAYPDAYVLGVTATPCRSDGQGFKYIYDDLVVGISPDKLIEQGYLSRFKLFGCKAIDTRGVRKTAGDYNLQQLSEVAMEVTGEIVPTWRKYADGKRTVVFAVGINHSKQIVQAFVSEGICAEHLDGETPPDERAAILERFRAGETLILSNCGIVTEGFDVPGIEAVQCVRPTASTSLWLQMIGRALRPAQGKDHAAIIDHSDNWKNHGLPDEERDWSLDPISLNPGRFVLQCPECEHCFRALSHEQKPYRQILDARGNLKPIYKSTCPSCLHEFDWEMGKGGDGGPILLEQLEGEVTEVSLDTQQWAIEEFQTIATEQQATGKKRGWIYYQLIESDRALEFSLGDWRYFAKQFGYKSGWAWHTWQLVREKKTQAAE